MSRLFRSVARAVVPLAVLGAVLPDASAATSGEQLWQTPTPGGIDAIVSSPDGTKVFAAGSRLRRTVNVYVAALDPSTGVVLWEEDYNARRGSDDAATDVAVSPDGTKVFAVGYSRTYPDADHQVLAVAFDASSGALLWAKDYGGPGETSDLGYAVTTSPDGRRVFVTGSAGGIYAQHFVTIAYRASTGALIWVRRYQGPEVGGNIAYGLGVSADGTKVYVSGESFGGTSSTDFATVAYEAATGNTLWVKRFTGPGFDVPYALVATGGKVIVTGTTATDAFGSSTDVATVAYRAADGAGLWTRRYDGPAASYDSGNAIVSRPDKKWVFIAGDSAQDYLTIAYRASDGTPLWTRVFAGATADYALSAAVSPDGSRVFVTGYNATVAYAASSGSKLWANKTGANELDIDPAGSAVFVGGTSVPTGGVTAYAP